MAQTGTLRVRVFTSRAQLPVEGATVLVTQKNPNGKYDLLSVQATNSSGEIRDLKIQAPPRVDSTQDMIGIGMPDTTCEVWAEAPGFSVLRVEGVQIFPGVTTEQPMALIPLGEGQSSLDWVDDRKITPQNL